MIFSELNRQNVSLKLAPPLDSEFTPPAVAFAGRHSCKGAEIVIADSENRITRFNVPDHDFINETPLYLNTFIKFLLWSRGGCSVKVECSNSDILAFIEATWNKKGEREFDCSLMSRIYGKPFEINDKAGSTYKASTYTEEKVGGNMKGCRIGFDLGASDYKICSMIDGKVIYADEIPWNPKDQKSPDYHINHINEGLKIAASKLPSVDAIGGSSAGVYINNRVMEASLFRSLDKEDFSKKIQNFFIDLSKEWNVPVKIINDGDVTALAGSLSTGKTGMLGIAMGSSEAVGYINPEGNITGWLNELAFAPVDLNSDAPIDEWSGDRGVGAQYFSQMAVDRLARKAGYTFSEETSLPHRLKKVQADVEKGDERGEDVFRTIGRYLGYTIPWYNVFYSFSNIMILGRVTSGRGGVIILEEAKKVLKTEFPELYDQVSVFIPDEQSRRTGQAAAAATLPLTEIR